MNEDKGFLAYAGDGGDIKKQYGQLNDPAQYLVGRELRNAVNVALILGQPLLVTGEPGTGKTQLARRVAHELGLPADLFPLVFNTKSTSTAKDPFYQYDALSHFHDAQIRRKDVEANGERLTAHPYITYEALGQAILLSLASNNEQRRKVNRYLPKEMQQVGPTRSVVLIDEIDKAPRDLPNDVLNEIENMSFTVREVTDEEEQKPGLTFSADQRYKPIVVITSNSERDLPDAFLRRCVYYHIEFPNEELLNQIVRRRLELQGLAEEIRRDAVRLFLKLRKLNLKKNPATAELLSWMRVLEKQKINIANGASADELKDTYSTLAKNADDLKAMRDASDKLMEEVRAENRLP